MSQLLISLLALKAANKKCDLENCCAGPQLLAPVHPGILFPTVTGTL